MYNLERNQTSQLMTIKTVLCQTEDVSHLHFTICITIYTWMFTIDSRRPIMAIHRHGNMVCHNRRWRQLVLQRYGVAASDRVGHFLRHHMVGNRLTLGSFLLKEFSS